MPFFPWITRFIQSLIGGMSPKVQVTRRRHSSRRLRCPIKSLAWLLGGCLIWPAFAWAGNDGGKGAIVAAGFGHQIGDVSTITVKTYNAETGEVLSDETYELDVKEEGIAKGPRPDERIFAGGVGPGATDLSNFVLRVYDAKTGKFQWEGNLNLTPRGAASPGQFVSTVVPRPARVTRIADSPSDASVPLFLLRALDPVTGGLMWQDEFSTGSRPRAERIANRYVATGCDVSGSHPSYDFRIRMFESDGRQLLWEDLLAQEEDEGSQPEAVEDEARALPTWPGIHERQGLEERI
ncbi:hypothetical protein ACO9S2_13355 [Nitrospira sp. NS4]|uniref:hypothetical protein n=1 Tax=Nitrospira sp. NS4 TaxID=3414498 RepID=UPI003C30B65E